MELYRNNRHKRQSSLPFNFLVCLVCWFMWSLSIPGCSDDSPDHERFDTSDSGDVSGDMIADDSEELDASGGQPGDDCTEGAACLAGLVCAYEQPSDSVRTCIDPSSGWVDDGTGPEMSTAGDWVRKRVTDWAEAGAVCNDGSPYTYFFSPGRDEGADKWLIFFKGGGGCADEESCAFRWAIQNSFMRQPSLNFTPGRTAGTNAGFFARDRQDNWFRDWNYIYLYYCSSDQHSGTISASEHPSGWHFRGHHNTRAVIEELIGGINSEEAGVPALPPLSDASTVVVAGGSAGAVAARNNLDWIASRIHTENPSVTTLGLADSIIHPAIHPEDYGSIKPSDEYQGVALDADCLEAHPDVPALCSDGIHLTTGGGAKAEYFDSVDEGHLGVASSEEARAAAGVFTFMGQFDNHTLTARGKWGWCVRTQCSQDAECGPGEGCLYGRCYKSEPCTPLLCSPDDVPCLGLQGPPACLGEVATHPSECNESAECPGDEGCCEMGEECMFGTCVLEGYGKCESAEDCDEGFACDRGVCSRGAEGPDDCAAPGYVYEPDTKTCQQALGCSERNPCDVGYTCLPGEMNPVGQGLSWGIREALTGLGNRSAPRHGVYVPDSPTHTAMSSRKYYGEALSRIRGNTLAEVVYIWMLNDGTYEEHVDPAAEVPLLLRAEPGSLRASGISARTSGSGCADDAIRFAICSADSACDQPSDVMASASVGDVGVGSVDGSGQFSGLKLVARFNGGCSPTTLALDPGSHLMLHFATESGGEATHRLKVALPPAELGQQIPLPVELYIGADGATWRDAEMTELAAGRLE